MAPARYDDDLAALLVRQRSVITVGQARRHLGPKATRWQLASGRWQRRYARVLVAHSGPLDQDQEQWAAVLHAGPGAVLAGPTAATLGGLVGYESRAVHLLVPATRHAAAAPGLVVRRSAVLSGVDIQPARLPTRTRLERSVLDAASSARDVDRAAALLLAAVQQRLTSPQRLRQVLDRLGRLPRRALLLQVLADADGGSHSLPERAFVLGLRRRRLPLPDRQRVRIDRDGRRRYLDAEWDDYGVRVKIDGSAHMDIERWWADLRRQNALTLTDGARLLRFPGVLVRTANDDVMDVVAVALRLGGWGGEDPAGSPGVAR